MSIDDGFPAVTLLRSAVGLVHEIVAFFLLWTGRAGVQCSRLGSTRICMTEVQTRDRSAVESLTAALDNDKVRVRRRLPPPRAADLPDRNRPFEKYERVLAAVIRQGTALPGVGVADTVILQVVQDPVLVFVDEDRPAGKTGFTGIFLRVCVQIVSPATTPSRKFPKSALVTESLLLSMNVSGGSVLVFRHPERGTSRTRYSSGSMTGNR